jgi:hypothetical protein
MKSRVHKTFRQLKALPIMNKERVAGCFALIKAAAPECLNDLVSFFERVYIGYAEVDTSGNATWKESR